MRCATVVFRLATSFVNISLLLGGSFLIETIFQYRRIGPARFRAVLRSAIYWRGDRLREGRLRHHALDRATGHDAGNGNTSQRDTDQGRNHSNRRLRK